MPREHEHALKELKEALQDHHQALEKLESALLEFEQSISKEATLSPQQQQRGVQLLFIPQLCQELVGSLLNVEDRASMASEV
jgi:hypothetical protein